MEEMLLSGLLQTTHPREEVAANFHLYSQHRQEEMSLSGLRSVSHTREEAARFHHLICGHPIQQMPLAALRLATQYHKEPVAHFHLCSAYLMLVGLSELRRTSHRRTGTGQFHRCP